MQPFREWVDQATFGVCSALARPLGIPSRTVRLYFVYVSFFTLGSPIILYFILGFWFEIRSYFRKRDPLYGICKIHYYNTLP